MYEYRVTKYDPAQRDETGAFRGDDWTAVSDIGRSFGGVVLTREEYERVEHAYVEAALAFLKEGGLNSLSVEDLEILPGQSTRLQNGSVLSLDELRVVIGQVLREEFWCNLQDKTGFIHFGYDYYMYIGVPHRCLAAERFAVDLGLFVETVVAADC